MFVFYNSTLTVTILQCLYGSQTLITCDVKKNTTERSLYRWTKFCQCLLEQFRIHKIWMRVLKKNSNVQFRNEIDFIFNCIATAWLCIYGHIIDADIVDDYIKWMVYDHTPTGMLQSINEAVCRFHSKTAWTNNNIVENAITHTPHMHASDTTSTLSTEPINLLQQHGWVYCT